MKKLELQNFGVVEMNNDEMREVVGGILPFILLAALAVEVACYAAAGDIMLDFNHYTKVINKGLKRGAAAAH